MINLKYLKNFILILIFNVLIIEGQINAMEQWIQTSNNNNNNNSLQIQVNEKNSKLTQEEYQKVIFIIGQNKRDTLLQLKSMTCVSLEKNFKNQSKKNKELFVENLEVLNSNNIMGHYPEVFFPYCAKNDISQEISKERDPNSYKKMKKHLVSKSYIFSDLPENKPVVYSPQRSYYLALTKKDPNGKYSIGFFCPSKSLDPIKEYSFELKNEEIAKKVIDCTLGAFNFLETFFITWKKIYYSYYFDHLYGELWVCSTKNGAVIDEITCHLEEITTKKKESIISFDNIDQLYL